MNTNTTQDSKTNKDPKSLAAKVRALLNKTVKNGATFQEAESAAAKAQQLIEKYALDPALIAQGETEHIFMRTDWKIAPLIMSEYKIWGSTLLWHVGQATFTYSVQNINNADKKPCYTFVGKKGIAESADYLFVYLCGAVSDGVAAAWSAQPSLEKNKGARHDTDTYHRERYIFRRNFTTAAVAELGRRLRAGEQTRDAETQALVVVAHQELDDAVKSFFPNLRAANAQRGTRLLSAQAREAGRTFGRNVRISAGVSGGAEPQPLVLTS